MTISGGAVVSDDEQINMVRIPGNRGDLLGVTVKDRLAGKRAPVRVPVSGTVPGRGPDVTIFGGAVVSNDEQVKIALKLRILAKTPGFFRMRDASSRSVTSRV